jgi:hypothetical protein
MISIYQLWESGELDKYIELEIIKGSVIHYCRIVKVYQGFRKQGLSYTDAVNETALKFGASEPTVRRAVASVI